MRFIALNIAGWGLSVLLMTLFHELFESYKIATALIIMHIWLATFVSKLDEKTVREWFLSFWDEKDKK